jgi:transcriptional regulator with XRE-family HTH domain
MNLAQYLEATGQSDVAFAERVGLRPSTINRIRRGETWPEKSTRDLISEASGGQVTGAAMLEAYEAAQAAAEQGARAQKTKGAA